MSSTYDVTQMPLGNILQILFSKGITSQMNRDYPEFDNILFAMKQKEPTLERQYQYMLLKSLGPSAVKSQNVGTSFRAFPQGQNVTTQEVIAYMKEVQTTIQLDWDVWMRAQQAIEKYAEPLEVELQAKIDASKRYYCTMLFGDGTGVLGTVASTSVINRGSEDYLRVTLSTVSGVQGFVGWFQQDELVLVKDESGAAQDVSVTSGTVAHYRVIAVNRAANTVDLQAEDSSNAILNVTAANQIEAGDVIYKANQTTIPNISSVSDYGTCSEVMAGLQSLTANDGRSVFGITMSGLTAGSVHDNGGLILDTPAIEAALNKAKIAVGNGKYSWDQMICAYEAHSALIEGREADRRFISVEDNTRGLSFFAYRHRNSLIKLVDSIFCPVGEAYLLPKPKSGDKEMGETGYAFEFRGTPFENVKIGGQDMFLAHNGSSYVGTVQQFLSSFGTFIAKQPAAAAVIKNFIVS